ncbi:hypothetical protein [Streptomyces sp. CB02959]
MFGRAFKRTYGVSPGEYRKRRLEAPCPSCRSSARPNRAASLPE